MTYSGSWEHKMFPAYVRPRFLYLPSQDLDSFLPHMYWSIPRWCEQSLLKVFKVLSLLCIALSSLILYLSNCIYLGLLKFSTLSLQLSECWTLSSPSLNCGRNFSPCSKLGQLWGSPYLFPFSQESLFCSPCFPTFEMYCFKFLVQTFTHFMLKGKLWLETKMYEEILWCYVNIVFSSIFLFSGFSIHWLFLFISCVAMMVANNDCLFIIPSTLFSWPSTVKNSFPFSPPSLMYLGS